MFVPHTREGELDGFRIVSVRPSSILARMGLQEGDVLHALDGREVSSLTDVLELYLLVHQREFVTMTVSRAGGPPTVVTIGLRMAS